MKYKVSIIIPVYNVENYIERCANSLFSQTLSEIEFLFINDCTPDRSIDVLNSVIIKYPNLKDNIKIINHSENKGLTAARTSGLDCAHGEYIIHCDSDDWIEPNMCKEMYECAKSNDADIVCSHMYLERGTHVEELGYPYQRESKDTLKNLYLLNGNYSSLCNKLVRKSLYETFEIKPLPSIFMWEDFSVTFRLRYHSRNTVILPKAYYHYIIGNGASVNNFTEKKILNQVECALYFEKYIKEFTDEADEYQLAINYVKFMSKLGYFANSNTKDLKKWKDIFPESNKDVLKYKTIPLSRRIVFYLGLHHSSELAYVIFQKVRQIVRNEKV